MAKKVAEGVTIAFLGTGAMDVDNATDLIEDYIESAIASDDDGDPVRFVFPLLTAGTEFSEEHWVETRLENGQAVGHHLRVHHAIR